MQQHIGMRLGAYQIVEQIGQGGMATVYKAYQPSVDRYVAIKILPSHFTQDESFVGRFTQEARTLARLEHPHILPVHDYGEQEGITYLVMRYVEAGTLKDLAGEGPVDVEEAARILDQVGRALDYAHGQGVVHRDIKPSNVLIDKQGNTFLTDFGIAKLVAETADFTASGAIIGTPAYMSPEQGMGQPTDYRCDIYSLGVVLYELVTGRIPFEAETPLAVLIKHVNEPLPPPRLIKPDLPEAVERVVLKAMAKGPDDRFQSAQEMVDALSAAVALEPAEVDLLSLPGGAAMAATVALDTGAAESPVEDPSPPAPRPDVVPVAVAVTPPTSAADTAPPIPAEATPAPPVADTAPPIPLEVTPPPKVADTAPPVAPGVTAPPQVAETAPPAAVAVPAPPPGAAEIEPPRLEPTVPARKGKRWLLFAAGAILLAVLIALGIFVVPKLTDGEAPPATVGQAQAISTAADQVQATSTTESQAETTPAETTPAEATQPVVLPSPAAPEQVLYPPGWTNYSNSNFVLALARQGDLLWAGGDGGLVRWDLSDGSYDKFSAGDGLPSNRITDLLVDEAGVLWIATDAGINRYDGESMRTYDEADGLDASWIQTLFQDDAGALWAGTLDGERGLNFYDGEGWGPPPIPPLPVEFPSVQVLEGNQARGLFVGLAEHGLFHYDGEEWTMLASVDQLPGDDFLDALLTGDNLYVSLYPAVVRFDLETGERELMPDSDIHTIHRTADGELWLGGEWRALQQSPDSGDWQEFGTAPGPIPGRIVTDIVEDEDGLWFGTYGGGVAFYDGATWETWAVDADLGGNVIEAIRQDGDDRDAALWLSHSGTGLSQYEFGTDTWQVFGDAEGALDWPSIPAVDSDGNLWIGDFGELLYYDGQGWQSLGAPDLADVEVYAITIGPGDIKWLVTDGGLMRHNPAADEWTTFTAADHPVIEDIWSLLAPSDGTVWLGGEEGLARYDGSSWSTPEATGSAPKYVSDLAEAPDGSLWVAADGELGHLAGGRWSYTPWPSDGWLEKVNVAADGSVWAGYEGLGRYNPARGDWQMFTPADGLIHPSVRAIHVTAEGEVWVGTEAGVSRFVPPD